MRIRITKATRGQLDGLDLSRLEVGNMYDVGAPVAAFLLENRSAQLAVDDRPALADDPIEDYELSTWVAAQPDAWT